MNTPQDNSYRPSARGHAATGDGQPRGTVENLAAEAAHEGGEQAQHYRDLAADKVDSLADSVSAAAAEMHGDDAARLSGHVRDMADGLRRLSEGLREKSADEILHDVRRAARENPTLFIAGSIAVGFGIARFARASAPRQDTHADRPARSEHASASQRTGASRVVPGATVRHAGASDSADAAAADNLTGTIPAASGPSAAGADAISARAGAAAGDAIAGRPDIASSTDAFSGSKQP